MIKIADLVASQIRRSPFLAEALQEDLINTTALARKLQPGLSEQLGKPVSIAAIVMAIKRLSLGQLPRVERSMHDFLRQLSDISVRGELIDYTFQHSPTLMEQHARLLREVRERPKVFYSFSRGIAETTIVIGKPLEHWADQIMQEERLLDKQVGLSAISIMLPAENRDLFGLYYYILKALAWEGINLIELISTSNEFTIVVRGEDLDQAFSIIMQLKQAN